jgi:exosortase
MPTDKEPANGVLEDFRIAFLDCWQRLPNKGFFFLLLAVWLALFHFLGNTTLGYIYYDRTPSLYRWMLDAYDPAGNYLQSDDGHGVIIPFVVLALFWWKRKELLAQPLQTWPAGLWLFGLALALHIFGYIGQQPKASVLALFLGIYGLMGLAWGPAFLKASFFPFFLFAFCVPLGMQGRFISFPLRKLVCQLVAFVANGFLAIDVQRDGTALINAEGHYQYEIAAACSGLRSLLATLALSMVYAFVSFSKWWKRLVLIASAFPLAVIGNLVRMLTIIIAAEIGGQKWGNYLHEGGPGGIFSLMPYVPAFAGLLLIGHWLREREPGPPTLVLKTETA